MDFSLLPLAMVLAPISLSVAATDRPTSLPPSYDVVWTSPSRDSLDSMPLSGRRGAGANVWVQDGSLWLYLSHSGAFDERSRLLKLGCLRLTPIGVTFGVGDAFEQKLDLSSGAIVIRSGGSSVSLWFAGETLYIEWSDATPRALEVAFATWRDRDREGLKLDVWGTHATTGDEVRADERGFVVFHRNADHRPDVAADARKQGVDPDAVHDVITGRVFGAAIAVEGGLSQPTESSVQWQSWEGKAWSGRTSARANHRLAVRLAAAVDADPQTWRAEAVDALLPGKADAARAEEQALWNEFWSRSHVFVNVNAAADDPGFLIGRNYQLFRYMLACNRDAELPLLFNGGIFTTDNEPGRITGNNNDELKIDAGRPTTPDFRRWLGCRFMSQNQRWLGWPALAGGDVDLLTPSLAFYRDRASLAAARAKLHGADGVVYPEPMDALGLCCVAPRRDGLCGAEHLTFHFSMMLEHAWMALQAHDALGIRLDEHLNWVVDAVLFYDSFYRSQTAKRTGQELDALGKLVLYPANGLEYAVGATNPIEVVAGLRRVTESLLRHPDLQNQQRARLTRILATLPDLPIGERDGRRSLLPARSFEKGYNRWEPIEHYAAWPYRLVGVTQPTTLQLARDTWTTIPADRARLCKQDYSWMANVVNMAACGWTDEAKQRAIYKMANTDSPQARFPAFFGPGHDWLPDHNWGGAGMTGIQEMLLAPEPGPTGKLYLLPAWPREWDVSFKLHAPGRTIVEAVVRGGRVVSLEVTPAERRRDIVISDAYRDE
jgi:hypothetical protein